MKEWMQMSMNDKWLVYTHFSSKYLTILIHFSFTHFLIRFVFSNTSSGFCVAKKFILSKQIANMQIENFSTMTSNLMRKLYEIGLYVWQFHAGNACTCVSLKGLVLILYKNVE